MISWYGNYNKGETASKTINKAWHFFFVFLAQPRRGQHQAAEPRNGAFDEGEQEDKKRKKDTSKGLVVRVLEPS